MSVRAVFRARRWLVFLLWRARLRASLRVHGVRLDLRADGPPRFEGFPRVICRVSRRQGRTLRLRLGRDVRLGRFVITLEDADASVALGRSTTVGDGVGIWLSGGAVDVGARCELRRGSELRVYGRLDVGDDSMISHGCVIHCDTSIEFGHHTVLAERVTVADADHSPGGADEFVYHAAMRRMPVVFEPDVLVSAGSVITRGTHLKRKTLVAANSVVRQGDWQPRSLLGGVPARELGRFSAGSGGAVGEQRPAASPSHDLST